MSNLILTRKDAPHLRLVQAMLHLIDVQLPPESDRLPTKPRNRSEKGVL